MKYFTVELLNRFRSDDEDVSALAHRDWEAALKRYRQREARIKAALPPGVRRFLDTHVCLHDARLLNMGRQGDTFVMILEQQPLSRDLAILMFTVEGELRIADTPLRSTNASDVTWLYEEWGLDRRRRGCFAVLLSNGCMVELAFRDFHYLIVQQVAPSRNGQPALSSKAVPRSA
jgi:hypothetical protein